MLRTGLKRHLIVLLLGEQPVMRAVPTPVLRVRMGVIRQAADSLITPNGGEVSSLRVDDVVDFLRARVSARTRDGSTGKTHFVIRQLDTGNHDDSTVSRVPIIV
jgi:hypothetical protein